MLLLLKSGKETQESSTVGSFPVAQFDSRQKPFVAFGIVPKVEFQFIEVPARFQPLNLPSGVHPD